MNNLVNVLLKSLNIDKGNGHDLKATAAADFTKAGW